MRNTTPRPHGDAGIPSDDRAGLHIAIPGREPLHVAHLVLDFNGTVGAGGHLLPGTVERVHRLSNALRCHLVTADTHGGARDAATLLGCGLEVVPRHGQAAAKARYVRGLGAARCVAIGNGANDADALASSGLGICVVGPEGAATQALLASDVVCSSVIDALDLLIDPARISATLRR